MDDTVVRAKQGVGVNAMLLRSPSGSCFTGTATPDGERKALF